MLEYVAILAFATAVVEMLTTCLRLYLDFREIKKIDRDMSDDQK